MSLSIFIALKTYSELKCFFRVRDYIMRVCRYKVNEFMMLEYQSRNSLGTGTYPRACALLADNTKRI